MLGEFMKRKALLFLVVFLFFFGMTRVRAAEVETTCKYLCQEKDCGYLGIDVYFYDDGTIKSSYYYDGHTKNPPLQPTFQNQDDILAKYKENHQCPSYAVTYQPLLRPVSYFLFYDVAQKDEYVAKKGLFTAVSWAVLNSSSNPNAPEEVPDNYEVIENTWEKNGNTLKYSIQYDSETGYYRRDQFTFSDPTKSPILVWDDIDSFQTSILDRAVDNNEWPGDLYCGTLSVTLGLKSGQAVSGSSSPKNGDFVCTFNKSLFLGTSYERYYSTTGGYLVTPSTPDIPYDDPDEPEQPDEGETQIPCEGDSCDLDLSGICGEVRVARTLQFVGFALFLVKLLVPAIIIFLGSADFAKAMLDGKGDDIQKKLPIFLKRVILGIIIFLIPSVIDFFYGVIDSFDSTKSKFSNCWTCVLNPSDCIVKE